MSKMPLPLSPTERRERVAAAVTTNKSNRAIASELGVDEATVRRDRRFLATPLKDRPGEKLKKHWTVRKLSSKRIRARRLKELIQVVKGWVLQENLIPPDLEYVLHEAGRQLHRYKHRVMLLPERIEPPSELLALTRPAGVVEDYMPAKLDHCVAWLSRLVASCLPREEEQQDQVLQAVAKWARERK